MPWPGQHAGPRGTAGEGISPQAVEAVAGSITMCCAAAASTWVKKRDLASCWSSWSSQLWLQGKTSPDKFPHPLLPHKVQQQPFSSASLSHTPLYLLPICVFSPTSPSPDCCSCVSPFVSSSLGPFSLPSSQQRGRFLSSLPTSTSPALGGGSPQAGLHQQLTRASPGYPTCTIPKRPTLLPFHQPQSRPTSLFVSASNPSSLGHCRRAWEM